MNSILYLSCSSNGRGSVSSGFTERLLQRLGRRLPDAEVVHRDLAANPPPCVDPAFCAAVAERRQDDPAFAASEILIRELERAAALVISTPMHNYAVPAVLKAWIDQVVRIGRTFASTPAGKVGLLPDRPVFVVVASGGWFTAARPDGAPVQPDFVTPYLRAILGTIGLHDLRVFTVEASARPSPVREQALAHASAALDRMLPPA